MRTDTGRFGDGLLAAFGHGADTSVDARAASMRLARVVQLVEMALVKRG
jgi:hypothetical protein